MKQNRLGRTVLAFALVLGLVLGAMPAAVSALDISEETGSGAASGQAAGGSEAGETVGDGVADRSEIEDGGITDGAKPANGSESESGSPEETGGSVSPEDGSEAPPAQEQATPPEPEPPLASALEEDPNADPLLTEAKACVEGMPWGGRHSDYYYDISSLNEFIYKRIRDWFYYYSWRSAVEMKVIDVAFVAPITGTPTNINGTDGAYSFIVEFRRGDKVQTTDVLTMRLEATAFSRHAQDIFFFDPEIDLPASDRQWVDELVLVKRAASYNMRDYVTSYTHYADMSGIDMVFAPVKSKTATLTASGLLKANALGTITAKVTCEGYTDTVTIKIVSGLQKVQVNQSQSAAKKLSVKKTFTPKVSYTPKDAALQSARWRSDNESVATVNAATGKVTAKSPGRARISLSVVPYKFGNEEAKAAGAFTWSYEVFVPATRVDITNTDGKVVNGQTLYLTLPGDEYSYYYDYGGIIDRESSLLLDAKVFTSGDETIVWSSDKKQKAVELVRDENSNGIQVNAKKAGAVTLTAKASGGKSVGVKIVVSAPKPIEIARADGIGAPVTLWAEGEYGAKYCPVDIDLVAITDNTPVSWKASEKGIVNTYPLDKGRLAGVVARKAGKVTLIATDAKGKRASINITVKWAVTNIEITNTAGQEWNHMQLWTGESYKLKTILNRHYYYTYNPKTDREERIRDDNPAPTTKTLVWSSDDPSVASVSSAGVVKALSPGDTYISVTPKDNPDLGDSFYLEVIEPEEKEAKKISIKQKSFSIHPGDAAALEAVVSPAGAGCYLEWYTNYPELIQFEQSPYDDGNTGFVRDLYTDDFTKYSRMISKKAKVTVVDRVSGKSASIYVTVSKNTKKKAYYPIENMRITKQSAWLQIGKSETLKLAMNEGRDPLTGKKLHAPGEKKAVWYITEEHMWNGRRAEPGSIAAIDPATGKVTAKGAGYVKVQAVARKGYYDRDIFLTAESTVYCMAKP